LHKIARGGWERAVWTADCRHHVEGT
jgi:hypothetical protein